MVRRKLNIKKLYTHYVLAFLAQVWQSGYSLDLKNKNLPNLFVYCQAIKY